MSQFLSSPGWGKHNLSVKAPEESRHLVNNQPINLFSSRILLFPLCPFSTQTFLFFVYTLLPAFWLPGNHNNTTYKYGLPTIIMSAKESC